MKTFFQSKPRALRNHRNGDLLRRMRNGENLTSFNSQSSWYPPRPIIQKDQEAIERLYGIAPAGEHLTLADANTSEQGETHVLPLRLA